MNKTISLLLLIFSQTLLAQQESQFSLTLEDFQGKWFINLSNFPMWTKGNKTHPQFNYQLIQKNGQKLLLDKVAFEKKGKHKTILGTDKALNKQNTQFIWRGKGILKVLKSKWKVVHVDEEQQWMIIYFEKTLFTPAGYDVISRQKTLSPTITDKITTVLQKLDMPPKLITIPQ